jgi:hypothetical protein
MAAARLLWVTISISARPILGYGISGDCRWRLRLIAAAVGEGGLARVEGRGRTVSGFEQGNFVFPTVLENVAPLGEVARTEIFGPVLCVLPFDDEADVIEQANDSVYGLAAGIWHPPQILKAVAFFAILAGAWLGSLASQRQSGGLVFPIAGGTLLAMIAVRL